MQKLIPRVVAIVSRVSARLGARLAWYLWFHPHGRPATRHPQDAEAISLQVYGHEVGGFSIGSGDTVLLVHGWGGASTDMAPLAKAVAAAGYRAVAPDLPGHGSDRGSYADVFRMAATLDAVSGLYGAPRAVVAHSFGAVVSFAAFQHGGPDRVVLVAPAVQGEWFLDAFRAQVGLSEKAFNLFRDRFLAFAGPQVMSVLRGSGDVPGAEMLILHDPADDRTPYEHAAIYADKRAATELISVPDSGHKGILRDSSVLARTIEFVGGAEMSGRSVQALRTYDRVTKYPGSFFAAGTAASTDRSGGPYLTQSWS